jgi:carbon monoxide dehydrogenase subunit G
VWDALRDPEVLRSAVPGCQRLEPRGGTEYAAVLAARVGPLADVYRGTFLLDEVASGSELLVRVAARGRCGRLEVHLHVGLAPGRALTTTALRYDARATVGGLVARIGAPALAVAGEVFTTGFFGNLDRAVRNMPAPAQRTTIAASQAGTSSPTTG